MSCETAQTASFREDTPRADAVGQTPPFNLPPAREQRMVEAIGDYEVVGKLGQGGMGAVYRARQVSLGREVALKVLPAHFEDDEDYVGRFQREAKVAASLSHPNLVRVYASGVADGSHYIAMELVDGENLRQRLKRGPLEMVEALRICADVARGLQCGWQRAQLIHRDIKPSNIYLSQKGEVKLGDLGLAKSLSQNTTGLTQTGTAMGTPHYMSPEQVRGEKTLDFRADIYSLGCTLYEMLTGQPPYSGGDGMSIMNQHLNSPPPAILKVLPSCPIPLARLLARMVKKSKHERPRSYEELVAELDHVREDIETGSPHGAPSALVQAWKGSGDGSATPAGAAAQARVPSSGASGQDAAEGSSKLLAYAALGVAVAILAGLAVVLMKPKRGQTAVRGTSNPPEALANSEAAAAAPAGPSAARRQVATDTPTPGAAALTWESVLDDPQKLELRRGATIAADDVTLPPDGGMMLKPNSGFAETVAMRARAVGFPLEIRCPRAGATHFLSFNGTTVTLSTYENGQNSVFARFPLSAPVAADSEYGIELRAEGGKFRAFINGVLLGETEAGSASRGLFGLQVPASAPKAVRVRTIEIAREIRAPGPETTTRVAGEPWQEILADSSRWAPFQPVEFSDGKLQIGKSGGLRVVGSENVGDAALRLRGTYKQLQAVHLVARQSSKGGSRYFGYLSVNGAIRLARNDEDNQGATLGEDRPRRTYAPDEMCEIELRIVGSHLRVHFNGALAVEAQDSMLSAGYWAVRNYREDAATIDAVSFLRLPASAAAPTAMPSTHPADADVVSRTPRHAIALPEAGWQPLYTESEWRETTKQREFKDGMAHFYGARFLKGQSWADGAIRARVLFRAGTFKPTISLRSTLRGERGYQLGLSWDKTQLILERADPNVSGNFLRLATYQLPKPPMAGDRLVLELRAQGDHLIGLLDGRVVVDVHDSTITGAGHAGVFASNAWFESVEVCSLPQAPAKPDLPATNAPAGEQ